LVLPLLGGDTIVSGAPSFTAMDSARFVLGKALDAMRKWKIRTKMVVGLCGLAFVIAVLVFNNWSQLVRDRYLATEISYLADEIRFAHELNSFADQLSRTHLRLRRVKESSLRLIESDRIGELEEFERSVLRSEAATNIELYFLDINSTLNNYKSLLAQHRESRHTAPLLVDRGVQNASLDKIGACLAAAEVHWHHASKFDHSVHSIENHHGRLEDHLNTLKGLTDEHFAAIQTGMKTFRDNVESEYEAKQSRFWAYTGLSAFLIAMLAWQFWTLIVVPFRTLFRGSQLIASGHHQHKILLGTDDEIGWMADTVNDITERFNRAVANVTLAKQRAEQEVRDRTREVIQNEQLASVGFLAAGVAHEINNPLGAIAWSAEALEETIAELPEDEKECFNQDLLSEVQTNLALIQSEAFRCKGITERLLHFSRLSDSTRASEDIGELVGRVVSMVGKVGEYRCKTIQMDAAPDVMAYCNSQEIQQVVLNLVSNALESVETDGKVNVAVRSEVDPLSGVRSAVVVVEDDGCGMDQEVMDHLFEPFFTRRRDDTGTGLGLSISYRIVSLHHGSLIPHSDGEGRGSRMVLRLPADPVPKEPSETVSAGLQNNEMTSSTKWNDVQKVA
jgi:signal transduction histidine kinase